MHISSSSWSACWWQVSSGLCGGKKSLSPGPSPKRDGGRIRAKRRLCIKHTLEFTIADIESVVVSSKCRGRGYGKELMAAMVEAAKKMNVHHIQLTSNPARVAANRQYQVLGFERYETNCYRLLLKG